MKTVPLDTKEREVWKETLVTLVTLATRVSMELLVSQGLRVIPVTQEQPLTKECREVWEDQEIRDKLGMRELREMLATQVSTDRAVMVELLEDLVRLVRRGTRVSKELRDHWEFLENLVLVLHLDLQVQTGLKGSLGTKENKESEEPKVL